jgi:type VI secretion system protein ImpG
MNRALLSHYNSELAHLRQTAAEFAREFPKIAGRLQLDRDAKEVCPDPFVERLLEGFAFLAARIQVKLDAEFPTFTQGLLETIYPHYLCQTPSMAVVQFEPVLHDPNLAAGFPIPRGTALRSALGRNQNTACEYRTAHAVTLWPIRIAEVSYHTRELLQFNLPSNAGARAVLRIRLQATTPDGDFSKIPLESIPFFLRGADDLPDAIYEQVFSNAIGLVAVKPKGVPAPDQFLPPKDAIRSVGFGSDQALMPETARSFSGYRLLREYFAFRQRFLFFEVCSLAPLLCRCPGKEVDLLLLFKEQDLRLEKRVDSDSLALFCSPAINLFERRLDRILLDHRHHEFQLIPDKTRPFDFEVFEVQSVTGFGTQTGQEQPFLPFFLTRERLSQPSNGGASQQRGFYTTRREQRHLTAKERQFGLAHSYVGSDVFLSLVDPSAAPYRTDLNQLGITALCTNRHLPLDLLIGQGNTDFSLEVNAPVESIRCLSGPTEPQPPLAQGAESWRLISHLSLNYLSLRDSPNGEGANALREMFRLYVDPNDRYAHKLIEGVISAKVEPIIRRMITPGPITFGRGIDVTVELDELAFEGVGVFVFGAVLAEFFQRYVSINAFTETVIRTRQRRGIMRWSAQPGQRGVV